MPAVAQVKKEDLATKTPQPGRRNQRHRFNGKNIWIYYATPPPSGDATSSMVRRAPAGCSVWRLGADYATVLHTDADLDLNGLAVPKARLPCIAEPRTTASGS